MRGLGRYAGGVARGVGSKLAGAYAAMRRNLGKMWRGVGSGIRNAKRRFLSEARKAFYSPTIAMVGVPSVKRTSLARGAKWFENVATAATRNADSDKVVLGHYATKGTSYQKVAAHYDATYFHVEREVIEGLSKDEVWEINKVFLKQQVREGKQILFSHNPLKARPDSFFEREVGYLQELGFSFRRNNQWTWEAIR